MIVEIFPVRREVASRYGGNIVIVPRVNRGVSEHKNRRDCILLSIRMLHTENNENQDKTKTEEGSSHFLVVSQLYTVLNIIYI